VPSRTHEGRLFSAFVRIQFLNAGRNKSGDRSLRFSLTPSPIPNHLFSQGSASLRQFKKLFKQSGSWHEPEQVELSSSDFAAPHSIENLYQGPRQPHRLSWIIPGKLAVGGLPQPGDGAILARERIKVVLSLCAQSEGTLPDEIGQNFRCLRFILPDSHYILGLQPNQLERVVELIHDHIQSQQPIYVHCLAGVERSPTACIAYLCLHQDMELWEAINSVKQAHPNTRPTEGQIQIIRELIRQPQSFHNIFSD